MREGAKGSFQGLGTNWGCMSGDGCLGDDNGQLAATVPFNDHLCLSQVHTVTPLKLTAHTSVMRTGSARMVQHALMAKA